MLVAFQTSTPLLGLCPVHNGICSWWDNGPLLGALWLVGAVVPPSALDAVTFMGVDFLLSRQSQMAASDLPGPATKGFSFPRVLLTPGLPCFGHVAW